MNPEIHELLQHDPANQPLTSLVAGTFAKFPSSLENISLDIVDELDGYTLVPTVKNGVNRLALRKPSGRVLTPMDKDRLVQVMINGKMKYFNVANLLASSILGRDVTDNEYGVLIGESGMWIESAADRVALCDKLKSECSTLPRVDLGLIPRPNSSDIDVVRGYYVERGVVYKRNGTPISVAKTGKIFLFDVKGVQKRVGLGWVLFAAYPSFYGYCPGLHTQMDHVNGDSTDNEAWNFRPVTINQNAAVSHRTGDRSNRPAPDSSHEVFKRDETKQLTPENIERWIADGSLKRFEETSYWVHRDGAVLRRLPSGSFIYASLIVQRCGYTYTGNNKVHVVMMKAFGKHADGLMVMHLDDKKENNRLSNLKMGTNSENAWRQHAVTIYIRRDDGTVTSTTYESEREAARATGVHQMTINDNRKRQRPGSPPNFTTTRSGLTFAATDPRE